MWRKRELPKQTEEETSWIPPSLIPSGRLRQRLSR